MALPAVCTLSSASRARGCCPLEDLRVSAIKGGPCPGPRPPVYCAFPRGCHGPSGTAGTASLVAGSQGPGAGGTDPALGTRAGEAGERDDNGDGDVEAFSEQLQCAGYHAISPFCIVPCYLHPMFSVSEKKLRHREVKTLARVHQLSGSGAETGSWVGLAPELLEHGHQWRQNLELAVPRGTVFCGRPLFPEQPRSLKCGCRGSKKPGVMLRPRPLQNPPRDEVPIPVWTEQPLSLSRSFLTCKVAS